MFKFYELWQLGGMTYPHESSLELVAERLLWLRKSTGLKQKQFAESINTLASNVSTWERGHQRLSLEGALRIAATYGVSLDFLFLGRIETLSNQQRSAWASRKSRDLSSSKSKDNPEE